mmetsp:Transcript_32450/g.69519  ORF Transcript_32450/g.69519 Transcript_32450/m.69519 type:complete len:781 (-) Transcript_32450:56-2398(-)
MMASPSKSPSPRPSESSLAHEPSSSSLRGGNSASTSGSKSKKLSGWLKSKAATLEGHVSEIRAGAALAAQDISQGVNLTSSKDTSKVRYQEETFEVVFIEKALGMKVDFQNGAVVVNEVTTGGQAERLQVRTGDRLISINGTATPSLDDMTFEELCEELKLRMKSMGRPCHLGFTRIVEVAAGGDENSEFMGGLIKLPGAFVQSSNQQGPATPAVPTELLAELQAARDLARQHEQEAEEAREEARQQADDAIAAVEEAAQLRASLADLQLSSSWKNEETHKNREELQAAQEESRSLREALSAAEETQAKLRKDFADLQRDFDEVSAARRANDEELQGLRFAASALAELQSQFEESNKELAQSKWQHQRDRSALEERAKTVARDAERERQALEERQEELTQELASLEARCQAEGEKVSALTAELVAAQTEGPRAAASECLVSELRREVERLRKEVQIWEVTAKAAGEEGADPEEPKLRVPELTREVERLKLALEEERVHHPASHGLATKGFGGLGKAGLGQLGSEFSGGRTDDDDDDSEGPPRVSAATYLEVRIAELEAQNEALSRQLNSRPIVFQFGSNPDEEGELGNMAEDDELLPGPGGALGRPNELSKVPMTLTGHHPSTPSAASGGANWGAGRPHQVPTQSGGSFGGAAANAGGGEGPGGPGAGAGAGASAGLGLSASGKVWIVCVWIRKKGWKAFVKCRKQPLAMTAEKSLRSFTRKMLQSPVLLWLFYMHVLVLWFVEGWRQAISSPVASDPAAGLEAEMVLSSTGQVRSPVAP